MKLSSAAILFLFIACIQAISASDFHTNSTSQNTALNHSKSQAQELLGRLYGSIKGKVKYEEKKNVQKYGLPTTLRESHPGKGSTGATGSARGNGGSSDVNRRPRQSFAPSLLSSPLFCASILTLYVSLALIFGLAFPFY